jgi:hypothetical protein
MQGVVPSPSRWCEFLALYGVSPVVFAVVVHRLRYRRAMFPILWIIALVCLAVMLVDPGFDRSVLWRLPLTHPYVGRAALRFVVLASLLAVLVRFIAPASFAWLPRRDPRLFALLAVGYPLFSCLPQGIIWRVFLMHRYSALFGDRATLIVFAALAFGLAHVTFRNVIAVVLTALGGALFADTYLSTGSMWLATLEHGAYGVTAFGLGLGRFLYLGARPARVDQNLNGA